MFVSGLKMEIKYFIIAITTFCLGLIQAIGLIPEDFSIYGLIIFINSIIIGVLLTTLLINKSLTDKA